MTSQGLKYGYNLSKQTLLDKGEVNHLSQDESCWLHFDYTSTQTLAWFEQQKDLEPIVVEALLNDETRPRASQIGNGVLLSLRGVNLSPQSTPDDMVSIRLWLNGNTIVSTYRRALISVADIATTIDEKQGPNSPSEFIVVLIDNLMSKMADTIIDLEDKVAQLEEEVLTSKPKDLTAELADLRRQIIALRRYLAPQKEALQQLQSDKFTIFTVSQKLRIRESLDHLSRYIEELASTKERATVTQEELNNRLGAQLNQRMYFLSIISAVFLPLGFLTGLLGINVGGIPGAENPIAFYWFVGFLAIIVAIIFGLFKRHRWF